MKKHISSYKVIWANKADNKKNKTRRSDAKKGGIKMKGNKGGALRKIYINDFCLMISLHICHPFEAVVIYQHRHER